MEEVDLQNLDNEVLFELLNAFEGINDSLDEISGDMEDE
jgi:hypothetical protein